MTTIQLTITIAVIVFIIFAILWSMSGGEDE